MEKISDFPYKVFSVTMRVIKTILLILLMFYEDGKMPNSVGWGASGPTNGESTKGYTQRDGGYDDCIMRIAQSMVNPDHYQLTWIGAKTKCNCQDYVDALRAKYREIKDDPEVNAHGVGPL